MIIEIGIHGCDDCTIFEIECSEQERDFLNKVAALSQETSTYGCMPTMKIEVKQDEP